MKHKPSNRISASNKKRKLLKKQFAKESKLTSKESMTILHEFEKLEDDIKTVLDL